MSKHTCWECPHLENCMLVEKNGWAKVQKECPARTSERDLLEAAMAIVAIIKTGAWPIATLEQLEDAIKKAEGKS